MNQGLCMFDAQGRIAIWNERYRQMYNIDPRDIWRGCNVPDLLASRMKAGTFPLDPDRYDADLRAALMQGVHAECRLEGRPDHRGRQSADAGRWLGRNP